MTNLYGGNILRIDLSKGKITKEPTAAYSGDFLGGRGINIKLLYDEVPPGLDPLDPASYLIFGVGPLCGTQVPASRVEVTAKSPETGFLASSNFGGSFGPELKFAGYDNIVITGKADKPVYLWIHNDEVEIRDASHLWGKDTYETQEIIRSEIDPDVKVACIGQAGENRVHFATVQSELGHGAGRTGTGGVMGSKNLKAIVIRGTKGVNLADPERYLSLAVELEQELRNDSWLTELREHGMSYEQDTWWPQLHAQPEWETTVHQTDLYEKYKPKRAGCYGCPTQCMDLYPVGAKGGGLISCTLYTGALYELRNNDVDLILEWILLAHRYGIDHISAVGILRWLMQLYEKGLITAKDTDGIPMEWGSREAMLGMLKKIVYREGFGNVLADGILPAAKKIGRGSESYADHMKGLPQYSPYMRGNIIPLKGHSLALAISPRGDTMRTMFGREIFNETYKILASRYGEDRAISYANDIRRMTKEMAGTEEAALPQGYEGKAKVVVASEDKITINDCTGACKISGGQYDRPFDEKYQAALLSSGTGIETDVDALNNFAKTVRNLERAFNVREGMTRDTDSLPKGYMDKPIEAGLFKGEVLDSKKFEKMKDEYYALRGWDLATGIPTRKTLEQTGLKDVARELEKQGKLPKKSSD